MGRSGISTTKLAKVRYLVDAGATISAACRKVGIATSTYYVHRQKTLSDRFPVLNSDWDKLTASYRPPKHKKLPKRVELEFRQQVGLVFRNAFSRPAEMLTTGQTAQRLRTVSNHAASLMQALDNGGEELSAILADKVEGRAAAAILDNNLKILRDFKSAAENQAKEYSVAGRMTTRDFGGRKVDPRVRSAVTQLADIFAKYVRAPVSHTISKATDRPIGRFDHFVLSAFKHFVPYYKIPKRALLNALRHGAARIDHKEGHALSR